MKNKGGKKTNMDKKGGEYTYTITGKEPVSERVMNTFLNGMMREQRGRLQVQCKYQKLKKAVTLAEDSGIVLAATAASPSHRNRDPDHNNADKDKDKKSCKGQWGRPPKKNDDKKEGSGNGKKNNDTTPKRIVVIKTEKNKSNDVTTAAATPAFTRQRARVKKSNNGDTASTHEIDSEEGEVEDDAFLEELSNTSMESLDSSESSSDESTQ